ncbi:hypothetical protein AXK61_23795 [Tsukamurella pseudospumae]|uniref:YbaB/EbfC DNA-binding family protein n=1 Tax=Tsukamurella pseudospumae TaxID=239498 RepID=A0A137Z7Z0_9ACTN|nr:hypothetical protein AXK61_23795 [Tsukamurella pseudospumae]
MFVHPVVQRTLDIADAGRDRIGEVCEGAEAARHGTANKDGDIAVQVNFRGELVDLWLKPGVLDVKRPGRIATEIAALIAEATATARATATAGFLATSRSLGDLAKELPTEGEYFPSISRADT